GAVCDFDRGDVNEAHAIVELERGIAQTALAGTDRLFGRRRVTLAMRRVRSRVLDHFENNELSSRPDAALASASNLPCSAINRAARMNSPQADRARAPPTLTRLTPSAAISG